MWRERGRAQPGRKIEGQFQGDVRSQEVQLDPDGRGFPQRERRRWEAQAQAADKAMAARGAGERGRGGVGAAVQRRRRWRGTVNQ